MKLLLLIVSFLVAFNFCNPTLYSSVVHLNSGYYFGTNESGDDVKLQDVLGYTTTNQRWRFDKQFVHEGKTFYQIVVDGGLTESIFNSGHRYLTWHPSGDVTLQKLSDLGGVMNQSRWYVNCRYEDPFYCTLESYGGVVGSISLTHIECPYETTSLCQLRNGVSDDSKFYFELVPSEVLDVVPRGGKLKKFNPVEFIRFDGDCATLLDDLNPFYEYSTYRALARDCLVLIKTGLTRANASKACKDLGGSLVSITDFIMNREVFNAITYYTWIGLNDSTGGSGVFTWDDGSSVTYTNWGSSQPSGGEYGVVMHHDDGSWHDFPHYYDSPHTACFVETELFPAPYIYSEHSLAHQSLLAKADRERCPVIGQCGFKDDDVSSVQVPRGWVLTLYKDNLVDGEPKERRQVFQGPCTAMNVMDPNTASSYESQHVRNLGVYPVVYEDVDFETPLFYITDDSMDEIDLTYDLFYGFANGYLDEKIKSIRVPGSFIVKVARNDENDHRIYKEIPGPIDIPNMWYYSGRLCAMEGNENIGIQFISMKRTFEIKLVVTEFLWDESNLVFSDEPGGDDREVIEQVIVKNPTPAPRMVTLTNSYEEFHEDHWFSQIDDMWGWKEGEEHGFSVTGEYGSGNGATGPYWKISGTQMNSWYKEYSGSVTKTSGNSNTISSTKTTTYEFLCKALPYTTTTCTVVRLLGEFQLPYKGYYKWDYPTENAGNLTIVEYVEGKVIVMNGGRAWMHVAEENTQCPSGSVYDGKCYRSVYDDVEELEFTFAEAVQECYDLGLDVAKNLRNVGENRFIEYSMCGGHSFWMDGYADSTGKPEWFGVKPDDANDYERFKNGVTGLNDATKRIMLMEESTLGEWDLHSQTDKAKCVACVGDVFTPDVVVSIL